MRDDQRREQQQRDDGDPRDLLVHAHRTARVRAVRDEHQAGEDEEVRDDRRAAVGHEGQRDPGQRDDPQDAPDDDERLQREAEGEPGGEQLREAVVGLQRDLHPAGDEEHEDEQQSGDADEAELLGERRVDEVGVDEGDQLRGRRSS